MPNVCAAIGLAQMENIDKFLLYKRNLTSKYKRLFSNFDDFELFEEPCNSRSNFWLQALILKSNNIKNRDFILKELNNAKIYARPVWRPMHLLKPYSNCLKMNLDVTEKMYKKIINIPSSAYLGN
jgi:perosamine synthetase